MAGNDSGSMNSPIVISDDEDEAAVCQQLCEQDFDSTPPSGTPKSADEAEGPRQVTGMKGYDMMLSMGYKPGMGLGRELEGPVEPIPVLLKRKLGESGIGCDRPVPGPSHVRKNPASGVEPPPAPPESKNARKRRRKLQRQALEAETGSKFQMWTDGANPFLPFPPPLPAPNPWSGSSPAFNPFKMPVGVSQQASTFEIPNNATHSAQPIQNNITSPRNPNANHHQEYQAQNDSPMGSTSAWVSSMVMAAELPAYGGEDHSSVARWSLPPKPLPPPSARNGMRPPSSSIPVKPISTGLIVPLPVKPPPPQIIGMQPDQDPFSKHGIFHSTPSSQSSIANAGDGAAQPYIPNPARTLVMEQLPKSHRSHDFLNSWCKTACGAYPVHAELDGAGKALVEFATAELARKAWASPRLTVAGSKPKGKNGRVDLIRVWWYRVDGVGAGGGVGEIEEGEIEGDAAERQVSVPLKKETKKEKKARLAREREAKMALPTAGVKVDHGSKLRLPEKPAVESTSQEQHPLPPTPSLLQRYPPQIAPSTSSGYNFNTSTPWSGSMGEYGPQVSSFPISNHQLPSKPPLPSQSDLGTHWRGRMAARTEPYTSNSKSDVGLVRAAYDPARNYTNDDFVQSSDNINDDHDSIASSRRSHSKSRSVASSRPGSPNAMPSLVTVPGPAIVPNVVDEDPYLSEDMEVDMDTDMDLEMPILPPEDSSTKSGPVHPHTWLGYSAPPPAPRLVVNAPVPKVGQPSHGHGNWQNPTTSPNPPLTTLPTPTPTPPFKTIATSSVILAPIPSVSIPSFLSRPSSTPTTTLTPPLPVPSEPRAMKNAPKGPSFAKRSLLARQKELEERIARSKLELGQTIEQGARNTSNRIAQTQEPEAGTTMPVSASDSASPSGSVSVSPTPSWAGSEGGMGSVDKLAMEDNLRRLVLDSQRQKKTLLDSRNQVSTTVPLPMSVPSSANSNSEGVAPAGVPPASASLSGTSAASTISASHNFSFDDLAVSFITETIQTLKPNPALSAPPPAPTPKPSSTQATKLELVAKQKQLEQHIAESKILMAKLTQARTKQEKEAILAVMRERSRMMDEEMKPKPRPPSPAANNQYSDRFQPKTQNSARARWPDSQQNAGVFVVSDDDDSDGDEM